MSSRAVAPLSLTIRYAIADVIIATRYFVTLPLKALPTTALMPPDCAIYAECRFASHADAAFVAEPACCRFHALYDAAYMPSQRVCLTLLRLLRRQTLMLFRRCRAR